MTPESQDGPLVVNPFLGISLLDHDPQSNPVYYAPKSQLCPAIDHFLVRIRRQSNANHTATSRHPAPFFTPRGSDTALPTAPFDTRPFCPPCGPSSNAGVIQVLHDPSLMSNHMPVDLFSQPNTVVVDLLVAEGWTRERFSTDVILVTTGRSARVRPARVVKLQPGWRV